MIQEKIRPVEPVLLKKPLLRGWFHAMAAVGAIILTVALCWMSRGDIPRMISMLIFGLSMIELYTVSAMYHIGNWPATQRRVLRTIDHANIFILIAGTYTPLCFNVLSGWFRIVMLLLIWSLAVTWRLPIILYTETSSLGACQSLCWYGLGRNSGSTCLHNETALDCSCNPRSGRYPLYNWRSHLCS